jgi:deoxyribose-phosphate aldolase
MSTIERNPGTLLDLGWVYDARVNRSAVERRTASLANRRSIKKDWQAAWLLKAVTMIDLTTLAGDDTPGKVHRMCAKARQPIRHEILNALGFDEPNFYVAAVCVYHSRIADALDALGDADIPIAAVSTGFPAGQSPFNQRLDEIGESVAAGAREIDIVISREHVLTGDWQALYNEVKLFREACGAAHLKTILATGELGTLTNVMRASYVCMMAGADFIKTSTGKENVNATLEFGLVMTRAIRDYQERTGYQIGFKPAGGIRTAKDALNWLVLIKEELGDEWLTSERFRFGASSLLDDIERQLSHAVTGRYAARHHIAMG